MTSTFPIIDNTQCSLYMRRVRAALPRSLSSPSHNIEGGNKNNGTHSTGLLIIICMCIISRGDALTQYLVKVIFMIKFPFVHLGKGQNLTSMLTSLSIVV